jgi:hypothetical protein
MWREEGAMGRHNHLQIETCTRHCPVGDMISKNTCPKCGKVFKKVSSHNYGNRKQQTIEGCLLKLNGGDQGDRRKA